MSTSDPHPQTVKPSFRELYNVLLDDLGPQDWWPADGPFEMMVGAVLTQNTAWRNVEVSIANLRNAGWLTPRALAESDQTTLLKLITPSGFMTAKAATLARLSEWVLAHRDAEIAGWDDATLRASLLAVKGVGPETADAIAMYVYDRALFIWDAYARRVMGHVWDQTIPPYETAKRRFYDQFVSSRFTVAEAQELHALVVRAGKRARTEGWDWLDVLPPSQSSSCQRQDLYVRMTA